VVVLGGGQNTGDGFGDDRREDRYPIRDASCLCFVSWFDYSQVIIREFLELPRLRTKFRKLNAELT